MTDFCVLPRSKPCQFCGQPFWRKVNFARMKFCGNECARANHRAKGPARFWAKVDKGDGCWLYTGFRKWDGYGWVARSQGGGKYRWLTAHRYAWILTHGEPPEGALIMHLCDVPACCNPDHLRLGTHEENMADMKLKGRHRHGTSPKETLLHPGRVRPERTEKSA